MSQGLKASQLADIENIGVGNKNTNQRYQLSHSRRADLHQTIECRSWNIEELLLTVFDDSEETPLGRLERIGAGDQNHPHAAENATTWFLRTGHPWNHRHFSF